MPIFSSYIFIIFTILGFTALSSCGDSQKRPGGAGPSLPSPFLLNLLESLENYPVQDKDCQEAETNDADHQALERASLSSWGSSGLQTQQFQLGHLPLSLRPLRGQYVAETRIEARFLRSCDLDLAAPPKCDSTSGLHRGWRAVNQGSLLRICRKQISPERQHAEHLALSAVIAIESAAPKIAAALPTHIKLEPVQIQVAPIFESAWTSHSERHRDSHYHHILTDNLSYFPRSETTLPLIAILPRRKTSSMNDQINLWESDFVILHEYAHLLEDSLGVGHFKEKRSHLRIAASEAFADTIAFAALGGSHNISSIPCMGKDRSPDTVSFYTGIAKIFTIDLIERASNPSMLVPPEKLSPSEVETFKCQGISPHSSHGMGAILAHSLSELVSFTPEYHLAPTNSLIHTAIHWIQMVNTTLGLGSVQDSPVPKETSPGVITLNMKQELETIAIALESAIISEFARQGQDITPNIRELLSQKMTFTFGSVNDHQWFKEN